MPKYWNQLSHISIISRGIIIHAIYRTSCISFSMSYLLLILFQIGSSFLRYSMLQRVGTWSRNLPSHWFFTARRTVVIIILYVLSYTTASGPKGIRPQFLDPALTGAPFEKFCWGGKDARYMSLKIIHNVKCALVFCDYLHVILIK